jgi:hypothetical protein
LKEGVYEVTDQADIVAVFNEINKPAVGLREVQLQKFADQWGLERAKALFIDPEGRFALYPRLDQGINAISADSPHYSTFIISFAQEMKKVIQKGIIPEGEMADLLRVDAQGNVKWMIEKTGKVNIDQAKLERYFYITAGAKYNIYRQWMEKTGLGDTNDAMQRRAQFTAKLKEPNESHGPRQDIETVASGICRQYSVQTDKVIADLIEDLGYYLTGEHIVLYLPPQKELHAELKSRILRKMAYPMRENELAQKKVGLKTLPNDQLAIDETFYGLNIYNKQQITALRKELLSAVPSSPQKSTTSTITNSPFRSWVLNKE